MLRADPWRCPVDLETLIVTTFCLIDDALAEVLGGRHLRQRGPAPVLADSEVLTMEIVGVYLGLAQDKALFDHFRRHHADLFPGLRRVHRTTFARQAAHLWRGKEALGQLFLATTPHDPYVALVDSFPVPACRFARAHRCRLFRGEAAFGPDALNRQTFYGFRCHVRACRPGIVTRFSLAPANAADLAVLPELVEETRGFVVADRNDWAPAVPEELRAAGITLLAPCRWATRDPDRARSRVLSRVRYRIDTTFGQLGERDHAKRLWARDT